MRVFLIELWKRTCYLDWGLLLPYRRSERVDTIGVIA